MPRHHVDSLDALGASCLTNNNGEHVLHESPMTASLDSNGDAKVLPLLLLLRTIAITINTSLDSSRDAQSYSD